MAKAHSSTFPAPPGGRPLFRNGRLWWLHLRAQGFGPATAPLSGDDADNRRALAEADMIFAVDDRGQSAVLVAGLERFAGIPDPQDRKRSLTLFPVGVTSDAELARLLRLVDRAKGRNCFDRGGLALRSPRRPAKGGKGGRR